MTVLLFSIPLLTLHPQVLVALTAHRRTEAQWTDLMDRVYWLEDTHRNMASTDGYLQNAYCTMHNAPTGCSSGRPKLQTGVGWVSY